MFIMTGFISDRLIACCEYPSFPFFNKCVYRNLPMTDAPYGAILSITPYKRSAVQGCARIPLSETPYGMSLRGNTFGVLVTSPPATLHHLTPGPSPQGEGRRDACYPALRYACTGLSSGNTFGAIRLHGLLPSPCGDCVKSQKYEPQSTQDIHKLIIRGF
jgi:hypothetical protein